MPEYKCPECQKPIDDEDALLCHFCGGSLRRAGKGFLSNLKYYSKIAIGCLVTLIILSFLLSMF